MLVACSYFQLEECPFPSPVKPMWSLAVTSGNAIDDNLQPMCLDDLLASAIDPSDPSTLP